MTIIHGSAGKCPTASGRAVDRAFNPSDNMDREWFALHGDRFTYARAALQYEYDDGASGKDWLVAVRLLGNGRIVRQFFTIEGDLAEFSAGMAARLALAIDRNLQHLADRSSSVAQPSNAAAGMKKRKA